jgi:Tol biopolymer transport system component
MKRVCIAVFLAALALSACGPETQPTDGATAEEPVAASQILATPLVEGVSPAASQVVTDTAAELLAPLPTPTLPLTDAVPMWGAEPYRVPVPDFDVVTVPELDNIRFADPRLLPFLPNEHQSISTSSEAWMLDDDTVLLSMPGEKPLSDGSYTHDQYRWNLQTNQVDLWLENAQNLSWGADGETLYYLSKRINEDNVLFDLLRYDIGRAQSELIRADIGTPFINQSPMAQPGPDGTLVVVEKEQPVMLRKQGDAMEATVLLRLPEVQPGAWRHSEVSTSPDRQTAAVLFSAKDVQMIYLVELKNLEVIAQFESDAAFWTNIDWSADGRRLAVADSSGVFVYDLVTGDTRYLVRREDLEFPPVVEFGGLLGSGADFVNPRWSPDGGVLLFVARCGLWAPGPTERPGWEALDVSNVSPTEITFAVTSDGSFIRPLSRKAIPFNLSRDRSSSWINSWDQDMPVSYKVTVEWK